MNILLHIPKKSSNFVPDFVKSICQKKNKMGFGANDERITTNYHAEKKLIFCTAL